jgi:hypothetical protein
VKRVYYKEEPEKRAPEDSTADKKCPGLGPGYLKGVKMYFVRSFIV